MYVMLNFYEIIAFEKSFFHKTEIWRKCLLATLAVLLVTVTIFNALILTLYVSFSTGI